MLVGEHPVDGVDRATGHISFLKDSHPFVRRAARNNARYNRHKFRTVCNTVRVGAETRVLRERRHARSLTETRELTVIADRQNHMTILGLETLVRHDGGVRIALPYRRLSGHKEIGTLVGKHRNLRIQKRHIDMLPLAGFGTVMKRPQNGNSAIKPGEQVHHGNTRTLRPATRHAVRLARDAHQPPSA
nr:hypothetical protein [Kordiimonas gwangyangensis]